ncbi:MAG TPA: FecR domain-containing protein, partial [Polyangiaceae bacterium]|nr:FecR domain-containing protein [Polyangiaceae bacterium]
MSRFVRSTSLALVLATAAPALAAPTPGYPERVLQWQVQPGETCEDIASSLYGAAKHTPLLLRYNDIRCGQGLRLPAGTVLVVPETVTELPPASLHSTTPTVKARPPAGDWANAVPGMPLYQEYSVNTLEAARADIRFRDRTRIYLAEHTLVVIYETATASAVTKQRPPAVELQEGEVQAGLAALAGRTVDVTTSGGGRVSAASRDAVLRRRGERTTVSVFDGSAQVANAGKTVAVPKNFGSSFVQAKPPTPPRPLPPAPEWLAASSAGVLLAEPSAGSLRASWAEVPKAVRYRFEVARDAAFTEVIVREETPADVRSFRAEHMPAGTYYLRVRAIDGEDFLGIASLQRQGSIVDATAEGGHVTSSEIRATPYSNLQLSRVDDVEVALDDHDFVKAPTRIDLSKQHPAHLRLRVRGSDAVNQLDVVYAPVTARIEPERLAAPHAVRVRVALEGVAGIDAAQRIAPRL